MSTMEAMEESGGLRETVESTIGTLRESANVASVYGDPIAVGERTIIPVARVAYGFGGGFGAGETDEEGEEGGEGGGGGGGVSARPVGVVEVTDEATRFVRFGDRRRLLGALALGAFLGFLLGRR